MLHAEVPDEADHAKLRHALNFVHCFFVNRHSMASEANLAKRCMLHDIETDWAHVQTCVDEDATVLDHFETLTHEVEKQIKEDGLVVRIEGTIHPDAKTNFLGKIYTALEVSARVQWTLPMHKVVIRMDLTYLCYSFTTR